MTVVESFYYTRIMQSYKNLIIDKIVITIQTRFISRGFFEMPFLTSSVSLKKLNSYH